MLLTIFSRINTPIAKISLLLLAILCYFFYSYQQYDLLVSDDDVYLKTGLFLKLPYKTFDHLLYPLGFKIFSYLFTDTIIAVYSYFYCLSIGLFISMFFFLKKFTNNFPIAFFISLSFLFSNFQIYLQPKISIFSLIIGFTFLTLLDKKKSQATNWGITAIALLLCNYVSQSEFFWPFCLAAILFLYNTFFSKNHNFNTKVKYLGLFTGIVLVLFYLGGGIYKPYDLKVAFILHFFDNYKAWYGKSLYYEEEFKVFKELFGNVNSNLDLITGNPKFFFKHVLTNLINYVLVIISIFKSAFYDIFLPIFKFNGKYVFGTLLLLLIVISNIKQTIKNFILKCSNYKSYVPYLLVFLLPMIIATLVIFPRQHFAILHLPFYFLLLAFAIKSVVFKNQKIGELVKIVLPTLLLLLLASSYPLTISKTSNLAYYNYLKNIKSADKIKLLSNDVFGFSYYKNNYVKTSWEPNTTDLVGLVNNNKFDAISFYSIDLEIAQNREFIKEGYKKTNYVRVSNFESSGRYLWVKPELKKLFEKK